MKLINALTLISVVLMPLVIYLSLDSVQPRYFAIGLVILFAIRFMTLFNKVSTPLATTIWLILILVGLGFIAYRNNISVLLSYPVLMNAGFLGIFLISLIFPPTIIEQLARTQDPDLPEDGVRYTRQVTKAWCGFFLFNGLIAAWTVWNGNRQLWGFYNGFISYLLTGLLMLAEYCIRCRVRRSFDNE